MKIFLILFGIDRKIENHNNFSTKYLVIRYSRYQKAISLSVFCPNLVIFLNVFFRMKKKKKIWKKRTGMVFTEISNRSIKLDWQSFNQGHNWTNIYININKKKKIVYLIRISKRVYSIAPLFFKTKNTDSDTHQLWINYDFLIDNVCIKMNWIVVRINLSVNFCRRILISNSFEWKKISRYNWKVANILNDRRQ